jgi:hypothetical protein
VKGLEGQASLGLVTRTPGLLALVLSLWLSGLVLAAGPLGFERPWTPRHPSEPVPRFEPPAHLCEPRFAEDDCIVREDLSGDEHQELAALVETHGREVERWRRERRPAALDGDYWRGRWPWFALAWTALALALGWRVLRGRGAGGA